MRKSQLLGVLILFIAIAVFGTTNFYWVSTEIGTPTSLFGDSSGGGDDPLNPNVNPPFPPTPPASETTPDATPADDPTEWAVFATEGKYKLEGDAYLKPKNESAPSGFMGTNAAALIGGEKPVILGGSNASVIIPAGHFYFGPGAKPADLVGGGNLGAQGQEKIAEFINNVKVLNARQVFDDPKEEHLDFPDSPKVPAVPNWVVSKGATQTQRNPAITKITITESGRYTSIKTIGEAHELEFVVGSKDLVVVVDTLDTLGAVSVKRNGNGAFYLFAKNAAFKTNTKTFDIDVGSGDVVLVFESLLVENKLNVRNVGATGWFYLSAENADLHNSVSTLRVNTDDILLRFDTLKMWGSTAWTVERVGEKTGQAFVFVENSLDLSGNTKLLSSDGSNDYIHLFYKGTSDRFNFTQFQLKGSLYIQRADSITVSGSSFVNNLVSNKNINLSGSGAAANSIFTPEGNISISGGSKVMNQVITGGASVGVSGGASHQMKCIYAPNALVELSGDAFVEGTVIAKNISMVGNSKIHFELVDYEIPEVPYPNRNVNSTEAPQAPVTGDPDRWVVFSVGGIMKFIGSVTSSGYTGTNATTYINGKKPVSFSGTSGIVNPERNFYIGGPGAIPSNVLDLPQGWSPPNQLTKQLVFPMPDDRSTDIETKLARAIQEAAKVTQTRPDIDKQATTITQSGVYNKIESGTKVITVNVGNTDIVLKIGIFKNSKIEINRNGTGRLFLFVLGEFSFDGSDSLKVNGNSQETSVFLFYLGSKDLKLAGTSTFQGNIYQTRKDIPKKKIDISGSGTKKVEDMICMSADIYLTGSADVGAIYCVESGLIKLSGSGDVNSAYCKKCNLDVSGSGKITPGVIIGGTTVEVTGSGTVKYVYAPNAKVTLSGSGSLEMVIGRELGFSGSKKITGPSHLPISPELKIPEIPIPVIP
ncbi:MAG TPA: DUF2807 domain-containing protein [Thermotogota bacterium]|nr:DUF2807 domain-containing protein [Thermotogota bacterium]HRU37508.1 DUF2807 domain-containing protein [Thermotogota bacterium]